MMHRLRQYEAAPCAIQILFVYLGGSVLRTMLLLAEELGFTLLLFPDRIPRGATAQAALAAYGT